MKTQGQGFLYSRLKPLPRLLAGLACSQGWQKPVGAALAANLKDSTIIMLPMNSWECGLFDAAYSTLSGETRRLSLS
jgi:hypothetical protein